MPRLRRTSPDQPGWTRRRAGRGFSYRDADGGRLPDDAVERIRALAIPPAWQDVWITPFPTGHLQAVGTDAAGRRQYLYHPAWRERRDAEKFERVQRLGRVLADARGRVLDDLGRSGMPLERAAAAAVRLIDLGAFRIGNDVYADAHGSFGLTTLERRHVRRRHDALVFSFVGKSGVSHRIEIEDAGVVEALEVMRRRRTDDARLLGYRERRWRALLPDLVNAYVQETTGVQATAKDFRTWHGTVTAAVALARAADDPALRPTVAGRRRAVAGAMREVAAHLGNTPALARSSYVDPRVITAFEQDRTIAAAVRRVRDEEPDVQQAAWERATLRLLARD
ncbi:DNA topoisomerase IB [Nocardioides sp. TRM66260-LWL]|uniref:DNA topoisomerase IB n=1 Tax=Nocardioides sp. TRM66260-LWL TaxID=2874478 RepID=UPI001CC5C36E|nr:DNA topoisomerase IB [Nocardioides sp. TRM66260-LWL]MBZ5735215.1 DNA topoisomerase IB [Nocardioides sp. TRM66260-LWL]